MAQPVQLNTTISFSQLGQRLDQALAELLPEYSRSRIKEWIAAGYVQVNDRIINKPREKMLGGERIAINAVIKEEQRWQAQEIALDRVFEDEAILVINKPRDLVVHPGAGNPDGTVLNALLHHYPANADLPRAGIVHRLDKDTTGLMVVAKTAQAQLKLVEMLQTREITREYEAIVHGSLTGGGSVDEPIGRHPAKRTHMAIHPSGKPALTHYRIMAHFRAHTHLRLRLESGRTHQIRVHMAHIHHPIVGDPLYGGRFRLPKGASERFIQALRTFDRQALHATLLRLHHPVSGELMVWQAPIPQDMTELIAILREDQQQFQQEA